MKQVFFFLLLVCPLCSDAQTKTFENDSMILRVTGHDTIYIEKPLHSDNVTITYLADTSIYPDAPQFIKTHTRYPEDAKRKKIEGVAGVMAYIDKDGEVSKAVICKSLYPPLDSEAMRVVLLMKDLKQDETKGLAYSMWIHVNVPFRLDY